MQLRELFSNLAKPNPPRLFNWDMSAHFIDSSLFIPVNLKDTLDIDTWITMYEEMYTSAYDTTWMKKSDSVFWPCMNYRADTVNLLVMKYDYYTFKSGALDSNIYFDFDTVNNILTDKAVRPGFPYDIKKVFAVSPSSSQKSFGNLIFRLGTDNIYTDNFNLLNASAASQGYSIELNFDDGNGWVNAPLGIDNYFHVSYDSAGIHIIKARVMLNTDAIAFSKSRIGIKKTRAGILDEPNQILSQNGMNINVYEPCSGAGLSEVKTLIYLEGIDILDFLPNVSRNAFQIYNDQIIETGLSDLRNFGYRILVVDWQNSRIDIRKNGQNLIDLLNELICEQKENGNNEQFVIIGESMGGLVANWAMMTMEKGTKNSCAPEKEHNTRLLITLDSPHDGAHIPMSIQKTASFLRNTLGGLVAGGTGMIASIPFGIIGTKLYFKSHDLFLDGDAAKQMLISHVGTGDIFWPQQFNSHNMRKEFLDELTALGKFPRHAKLMAMSNGNMKGVGQTQYWDGLPRTANDRLIHVNRKFHFTILKKRFYYAGAKINLNTDPNGSGNLGNISMGTWWIKIRLKIFGIKIKTGFNSVVFRDWDADMRPISTSSGGLLDYTWALEGALLSSLPYSSNGNYASTSVSKTGSITTAGTEGFGWCFIPTASALAFGNNLNVSFDGMGVNTVMGLEPFDVICGVQGDTAIFQPSTQPFNFRNNVYIRNAHHTAMRNDTLFNNFVSPKKAKLYTACPGGAILDRPMLMMNREIGDNELYIENRILPWRGAYSVTDKLYANVRNPTYRYPNTTANINTLWSFYSKPNSLKITNTGFGELKTNSGIVQYVAPFTGPFSNTIYSANMCCANYYRIPNPSVKSGTISNMFNTIIYPNPNDGNFNIQISSNQIGNCNYSITDIMGKIIYNSQINIDKLNTIYTIPTSIKTISGIYILQTEINNQKFTTKINIQ